MQRTYLETELILNADGSVYHLQLLPEEIADVIIAVGDPERVSEVSRRFDAIELRRQKREFVTHTGRVGDKRVSVISSGMGTDNVEIMLTELDALANIDLTTRQPKAQHRSLQIIRVGTSGAMQANIETGSHLASTSAIGLDTLMAFYALPQSADELALLEHLRQEALLPFMPYITHAAQRFVARIPANCLSGCTLTCPGFYAPQGRNLRAQARIPRLMERLQAFGHGAVQLTNFEMETAGYYALATLLGHEAISYNAIIANRVSGRFDTNASQTISSLIDKVLAVV